MLVASVTLLFLVIVALGLVLSGRSANAPQIDAAIAEGEISTAGAEPGDDELAGRLDEAQDLMEGRRYDEARSILKDVLEKRPNHPRAEELFDTLHERTQRPKPKPLPR